MAYDQPTKELFINLRADGISLKRIAHELDIGKHTLINWNHHFKDRIDTEKKLRLDDLQEKYHILREHRIELFGEKLQNVLGELAMRRLNDVSTPRLLELVIKYSSALKREEQPINIEPDPNAPPDPDDQPELPTCTKSAPEVNQNCTK